MAVRGLLLFPSIEQLLKICSLNTGTFNTRTAGAAASPQRPKAVILTASFDLRYYAYMLGVAAIKVSEKYSVHELSPQKAVVFEKKTKTGHKFENCSKIQVAAHNTHSKNNKKCGYFQNIVNRKLYSGLGLTAKRPCALPVSNLSV